MELLYQIGFWWTIIGSITLGLCSLFFKGAKGNGK